MSFNYQLKWTETGDAILPAPRYSVCDADGRFGLRRNNEGISLHDTYEAAIKAAQDDFDLYAGRATRPQPMETAPKDGTWIRLLIDYTAAGLDACPLEDSAEPGWTIGSNNFENTEVDEWSWMGWDWSHDCIRETRAGKPIGWAPFHERSENGNELPVSGKVFPADLIANLTAERDEADRRAGASERRLSLLEETERKRRIWQEEQKASEGVPRTRPFNDAWKKVRQQRDEALNRISNACELASETAPNWETRCRRILAALGLDFGDPAEHLPDSISDEMVSAAMDALMRDQTNDGSVLGSAVMGAVVWKELDERMRAAIDAALRIGRNQKFPLKR